MKAPSLQNFGRKQARSGRGDVLFHRGLSDLLVLSSEAGRQQMNASHADFSHIHHRVSHHFMEPGLSGLPGWPTHSLTQLISIGVLDASGRPCCGISCCTRWVNVANCVLNGPHWSATLFGSADENKPQRLPKLSFDLQSRRMERSGSLSATSHRDISRFRSV